MYQQKHIESKQELSIYNYVASILCVEHAVDQQKKMEKSVFSFYNLINEPRFLQPTKSFGLADKQKEQDRVDIFRARKSQVKKFPKTIQRIISDADQKKKLWGEGIVTHNDPGGINVLPQSVGDGV